MNISVVTVVRYVETTSQGSLAELSQFEDVVVYDNESVDRTREINRQFNNVRLIQGYFDGFGPTKNRTTPKARGWSRYDQVEPKQVRARAAIEFHALWPPFSGCV